MPFTIKPTRKSIRWIKRNTGIDAQKEEKAVPGKWHITAVTLDSDTKTDNDKPERLK